MSVTIRPAAERDLEALVAFEIRIAEVSFGDRAITEPDTHRKRLAKGLERDPESVFVAVDDNDEPVGWLWMAINTNFLTQERYGNLRSLAVSDGARGTDAADALLDHALRYAEEHELTELTGKVAVSNTPMRATYRAHGFEPATLTMRWEKSP